MDKKDNTILYVIIGVVAVLVLVWLLKPRRHPLRNAVRRVHQLTPAQRQALMSLGEQELASLKSAMCPVCQDSSGQCNCPQ